MNGCVPRFNAAMPGKSEYGYVETRHHAFCRTQSWLFNFVSSCWRRWTGPLKFSVEQKVRHSGRALLYDILNSSKSWGTHMLCIHPLHDQTCNTQTWKAPELRMVQTKAADCKWPHFSSLALQYNCFRDKHIQWFELLVLKWYANIFCSWQPQDGRVKVEVCF